jgi:hypothetical protein
MHDGNRGGRSRSKNDGQGDEACTINAKTVQDCEIAEKVPPAREIKQIEAKKK